MSGLEQKISRRGTRGKEHGPGVHAPPCSWSDEPLTFPCFSSLRLPFNKHPGSAALHPPTKFSFSSAHSYQKLRVRVG